VHPPRTKRQRCMGKSKSKWSVIETITHPREHTGEPGAEMRPGDRREVRKSVWGMPRLSKAKKDVISCEKLRGVANRL
jgi:hypothetical protein